MGNTWKNMVVWCFLLSLVPLQELTRATITEAHQAKHASPRDSGLVLYGLFRVTPLGSCSFREVTELS